MSELIDKVLTQIKTDVDAGEFGAIEELIIKLSEVKTTDSTIATILLKSFLPEEEHENN
jgi:hypothetical protein